MGNKKIKKRKSKSNLFHNEGSRVDMVQSMASEDLTNLTKRPSLRDTVQKLRDQRIKQLSNADDQRTFIDGISDSSVKSSNAPFVGYKLSKRATEQLTVDEIKDLRMVFTFFDLDSSGFIEEKELHKALKVLGFKVKKSDIRQMMSEVDIDKSGQIDFSEFLEFVISRQGDSRDIYGEIMHGFDIFDHDKSGYISLENLKWAAKETGTGLSNQELEEMIYEADKDGDGMVDSEEFISIMLRTNLFL